MKTVLLFPVISLFCLVNVCSGQAYSHIYYFDKDLGNTKESKAVILGKGIKADGLFRLDYFGKQEGELLGNDHFVDSSLKILQGPSTRFHKNGKVESQCNFLNNQVDGIWQKWDDKGLKTDSTIYREGKAFSQAKFYYRDKGRLMYYSFKDSLTDTYMVTSYGEKGIVSSEAFFKGQTGILKTYDSGTVKLDSLFSREEREASFTGGQPAWIRYLQKNLNANTPVDHGAPEGKYQVIVKFIVAKDGSISDVRAETKWGYGMEKEVIRIIEKGPAWTPAIQFGRRVNAYRRQPVTFIVETRRR